MPLFRVFCTVALAAGLISCSVEAESPFEQAETDFRKLQTSDGTMEQLCTLARQTKELATRVKDDDQFDKWALRSNLYCG